MIVSGGGLMATVSNTNQYQVVSITDIAKKESNIPIQDIAEFELADGKLFCSKECAQKAVDTLIEAANKNLKEKERKDLKRQRFIDSLNSVKKGSN